MPKTPVGGTSAVDEPARSRCSESRSPAVGDAIAIAPRSRANSRLSRLMPSPRAGRTSAVDWTCARARSPACSEARSTVVSPAGDAIAITPRTRANSRLWPPCRKRLCGRQAKVDRRSGSKNRRAGSEKGEALAEVAPSAIVEREPAPRPLSCPSLASFRERGSTWGRCCSRAGRWPS